MTLRNPGRLECATGAVIGTTLGGFLRIELENGHKVRRLSKNVSKKKRSMSTQQENNPPAERSGDGARDSNQQGTQEQQQEQQGNGTGNGTNNRNNNRIRNRQDYVFWKTL